MKKVLKRTAIALIVLFILAQIPFVYRRIHSGRLDERLRLERQSGQIPSTRTDGFVEYKGVIHVHTSLGGHSTGGFDELIDAANANDLDFVVMNEHYSYLYDTAAKTLNGNYGKTLFIGGNEIDTSDGDRLLIAPGDKDAATFRDMRTTEVVAKLHADGKLALIAYPETHKDWETAFDGEEIFSLSTNSRKINPAMALFDMIWSCPAYLDVTIAQSFRRPDDNLKQYDAMSTQRRSSLFAGLDAHSNIGFHLFGDDAGNKPFSLKIDPYKLVFRLIHLHLLQPPTKPLSRESIVETLKNGNFFTGFDVIGDSNGFSFTAVDGVTTKTMGDEMTLSQQTILNASSPIPARFVVFKNGAKFFELAQTREMSVKVNETGAYRVEAYRDELGSPFDTMPWIISNPIYVR